MTQPTLDAESYSRNSLFQGAALLVHACMLCLTVIALQCCSLMLQTPELFCCSCFATHACILQAALAAAHSHAPWVVAECSFCAAVRATAVDPLLSQLPSQIELMTSTELKATLQQVRA